ncbi:MAG TPA: response regulator transcription factor [Magnetospirillum sp.]|nr:response regulator transcription factor [Magnetospirillum sp.]
MSRDAAAPSGWPSCADDTAMPQTTVLLLDRRALNRECLSNWLAVRKPGLGVVAHASVREAASQGVTLQPHNAVVLYSVGAAAPSDPEVTEEIAQIEETFPAVPIFLISDSEEISQIVEALDLGVRGYIPTSIGISVIIGAIQLVLAGGTFVPAGALASITRRETVPASQASKILGHFTPRQAQVLSCLRQGKANKNIAYELNMCESTVKVHVRHIMKKLKATNRTQVAFLTNQLFGDDSETPAGTAAQ